MKSFFAVLPAGISIAARAAARARPNYPVIAATALDAILLKPGRP